LDKLVGGSDDVEATGLDGIGLETGRAIDVVAGVVNRLNAI
jgi:hypothetical protein